jgi:ABC-type lipoprotein export system ATPase subunit
VAIARSLIARPPLLFADEPTGNLDSHVTVEVLDMFKRLNKEDGITVIIVTHDAEIASHTDRVVRIRDGLIESGAFQKPQPMQESPRPAGAAVEV